MSAHNATPCEVPLPPLPISECAESNTKVVRVRGLPFAVTRFQIRQFFRAFQIDEDQPADHIHHEATGADASTGPVTPNACDPASSVSDERTARKGFSSDSLSGELGDPLTPTCEDGDSSKDTTPGATTPRNHPRWSALMDMENSSIVWFPSGAHRGEGFIRLKHSEDVPKAVEILDRNHFADRTVDVSASTEEARQACVEAFKQYMEVSSKALVLRLRGLPFSAEEEDVRAFIRSVEGVVALDICRDATGRNTGDAFIELESEKNVAQAKRLHEKMMGRRYIEVLSSSAHDRLCVLRAAARKSGFVQPHNARHAPRLPRASGSREDSGAAHHPHRQHLPYAPAYGQESARHFKGSPHTGTYRGAFTPSYASAGLSDYRTSGGLYSGHPSMYMSGGEVDAYGMQDGVVDVNGAGYGYGYGQCYNYDGYGDGCGSAAYNPTAASGWWQSSMESSQGTPSSTRVAALNRPHKTSHFTGKAHNPYSYSAFEGPSAAASWDCVVECEEPSVEAVQ